MTPSLSLEKVESIKTQVRDMLTIQPVLGLMSEAIEGVLWVNKCMWTLQ